MGMAVFTWYPGNNFSLCFYLSFFFSVYLTFTVDEVLRLDFQYLRVVFNLSMTYVTWSHVRRVKGFKATVYFFLLFYFSFLFQGLGEGGRLWSKQRNDQFTQ